MPDPRWTDISGPEAAVALDTRTFCVAYSAPAQCPIDGVYSFIQSTIVLGQQDVLDQHPALGRLLLLGFVSSVDDYFRRILSGLVAICPLSRARLSDKPVPFGTLEYYEPRHAGMALFENTSFASLKDIRLQTETVAGLRFNSESLAAAIEKYEKLCQMRHATTHAGGALSMRNARELGVPATGTVHQVVLDQEQLQTSAAVCYSAARAYNRWLYRKIVEQWIGNRLLIDNWTVDRDLLRPLFELFRSREDAVAPRTAYHGFLSMRSAIAAAASSFQSDPSG